MIEQLLLSEEQLSRIKNQEKLGSGAFADVYDYDKDNIIKIWNDTSIMLDDHNTLLEKMLASHTYSISSDIFLFPNAFVFVNEEFRGILRKKVDGQVMTMDLFLEIELEKLYNMLMLIYTEISKITREYLIKMEDFKFHNMMYDNKKGIINIIDTDLYKHIFNANVEQLSDLNKNSFSILWYRKILPLLSYIKNRVVRDKLGKAISDHIDITEVLYTILEQKEENINSFSDIMKYTLK